MTAQHQDRDAWKMLEEWLDAGPERWLQVTKSPNPLTITKVWTVRLLQAGQCMGVADSITPYFAIAKALEQMSVDVG